MDLEMLARVAESFLERRAAHLSPGERRELFAIAQALSCKESATALGVCYETVRARRKRVYRKLGLAGAGEVTSWLLRVSLEELERRAPAEPRVATSTGLRDPAHLPSTASTLSDAIS
jgi:DNA-binding CsgD family transcriptional regulator